MHGGKEQKERFKVMAQFKSGEFKLLIATDVSARGIDIANVDYVVNYDLPEQSENYVHRVGRTGRGTQKGNAVSFCSEEEKSILEEIESFLGAPIKVLEIDKADYSATLDGTKDTTDDWKAVMRDIKAFEEQKKKKKRKKKR